MKKWDEIYILTKMREDTYSACKSDQARKTLDGGLFSDTRST